MIPITSGLSIKLHALEKSRGLISIWHMQLWTGAYHFFQNFWAFFIQETVNVFLLVFSGIWLSICFEMFFQKFREMRNIVMLSTTPSHCIRMADSVQWFSHSDYSICNSILMEFYRYLIWFLDTNSWLITEVTHNLSA